MVPYPHAIVVEGRADVSVVRRAVDALVLETGGHHFRPGLISMIQAAHAATGVVVLTDPDRAGEQIRRRLVRALPTLLHARLAPDACRGRSGGLGVEHASPAEVLAALQAARGAPTRPRVGWTLADLLRLELVGVPDAATRRARVAVAFDLGPVDGRRLRARLEAFGVPHEEVERVLTRAQRSGNVSDEPTT